MKLARVLRSEPVDVIHAHHYEGCLVAAAARVGTGVPLIFDVHTLLGSELQHYDLPLLQFRVRPAGWRRTGMSRRWRTARSR